MNKVITISRQFGSGGREFGIKLAHELKLPFYDKDLISMAAQNSNLSEEFMRHYEESAPGIFSRSLYSYYQMPMTDQIYIAQSNLIKQLAAKGRASSSAAARTSSSRTASKFTCTPTLKSASNANFPWIRHFPRENGRTRQSDGQKAQKILRVLHRPKMGHGGKS